MHEELPITFKPIKVPCEIRKDVTFVYCFLPEELLFLSKFDTSATVSCPKQQRKKFEVTDLTDLVEKGLLAVSEGAVDIYYSLTAAGRRLIEILRIGAPYSS